MTEKRVWQVWLVIICLGIWALPGRVSAEAVMPAAANATFDRGSLFAGVYFNAPHASDGRHSLGTDSDVQWDIGLSAGLRNDSLNWSKAGTIDVYPNVTSELAWTDITSHQLILEGSLITEEDFYSRAALGYALINGGEVRDSDYRGDHRTEEYSRSVSATENDALWDLSVGCGPIIHLIQGRLTVAPLVGISVHRQNLRITDGKQVIASPALPATPTSPATPATPSLGALDARLNSTFQAKWQGPWVGVDLKYRLERKLLERDMMAALSVEHHFAVSYSATANWNLRSDLNHPVSFRQNAQGSGWLISGRWSMALAPHIGLNLGLTYQYWTTRPGTMRMYYADGFGQDSPLNEAQWQSTSIGIGVVVHL